LLPLLLLVPISFLQRMEGSDAFVVRHNAAFSVSMPKAATATATATTRAAMPTPTASIPTVASAIAARRATVLSSSPGNNIDDDDDDEDDGWGSPPPPLTTENKNKNSNNNDRETSRKLAELRSLREEATNNKSVGGTTNIQRQQQKQVDGERDLFIPIMAVVSLAGLFGAYGYETLRLASRGELYLPF
jgi:hypothetical protein